MSPRRSSSWSQKAMRSSSSSSRSSGVKGSPLYNPCVMKVIVARDLVKYHGGDLKVLSGATLSVEAGEKIELVGRREDDLARSSGRAFGTRLWLCGASWRREGRNDGPEALSGRTGRPLSGGGDLLRLRALDGPREGARGAWYAPLRGPIERAHGALRQASERVRAGRRLRVPRAGGLYHHFSGLRARGLEASSRLVLGR